MFKLLINRINDRNAKVSSSINKKILTQNISEVYKLWYTERRKVYQYDLTVSVDLIVYDQIVKVISRKNSKLYIRFDKDFYNKKLKNDLLLKLKYIYSTLVVLMNS